MRLGPTGTFALAVALASATAAPAQQAYGGRGFRFQPPSATVTVYGGLASPSAGSELFRFTTSELTIDRSDFVAGTVGVDFAFMLGDRTDLVLSLTRDESRTGSEFRDWVDNFGQPIEQTTSFLRQPLTASVRYNLTSRGRRIGSYAWVPARIVPFVGAGAGLMKYRFEQVGDFIDMGTLDVFTDRFTEEGWSPVAQLSGGATVNLTPHLQFVGELRYLRAKGDATGTGDFQGFGRLDLSGASSMFGISLRF